MSQPIRCNKECEFNGFVSDQKNVCIRDLYGVQDVLIDIVDYVPPCEQVVHTEELLTEDVL